MSRGIDQVLTVRGGVRAVLFVALSVCFSVYTYFSVKKYQVGLRQILCQIKNFNKIKELGNEIRRGRKYSKIRPMSGSLPNSFAGDSRPLATNITQEKCHSQASSWICKSFISQLRSAPSRNNVSSRDRGSPHCRRSGE